MEMALKRKFAVNSSVYILQVQATITFRARLQTYVARSPEEGHEHCNQDGGLLMSVLPGELYISLHLSFYLYENS